MKKTTNLLSAALALSVVVTAGLGCGSFSLSRSTPDGSEPRPYPDENRITGTAPPPAEKSPGPKIEKADFTVTAEELDKEYTRKGVKSGDLAKYASKTIAVTGRVSMLVTEKKGTTQPWVTLYAPGVMHGVSCYFDDDNLEQMKRLKMDQVVTVQGVQDDFIVPEVSPRLDHCVVVRAE